MTRAETDRAVESALSVLIVAVVIGAAANLLGGGWQAVYFWLMRSRGWSSGQLAAATWLWSWVGAFRLAANLGIIAALWRIARALGGGRARGLAVAAAWTIGAALVLSLVWQVLWPSFARRWGHESIQTVLIVWSALTMGLTVIGKGLLLTSLVAVARTMHGARGGWIGRAAVAILTVILDVAWVHVGYARLLDRPLVGVVAGSAVVLAQAAAFLAFMLPLRRAWRAGFGGPTAAQGGPYRSPEAPRGAWRGAAELGLAAEGLLQIRRRVVALATVTGVAIPVFFVLASMQSPRALLVASITTAALQVYHAFPLAGGLGRYTRAPFELPGRSLAIAALVCMYGSLAASLLMVLGLIGSTFELEVGLALLGMQGFGGGIAFFVATVLLVIALGRAARALGASDVRRRAALTLTTYLAGVGLGLAIAFVALRRTLDGMTDALPLLVLGAFVVALICMTVYAWLLSGAAAMLGGSPPGDPSSASA